MLHIVVSTLSKGIKITESTKSTFQSILIIWHEQKQEGLVLGDDLSIMDRFCFIESEMKNYKKWKIKIREMFNNLGYDIREITIGEPS